MITLQPLGSRNRSEQNLPRTKREVSDLLTKKLGITPRAIYYRIKKVKDELGYGFSDNIALMVIAGEQGIDVYPYLELEEINDYREALKLRPREIQRVVDSKPTEIIRVVKVPNMPDIKCPNLPERVYQDAEKMTEVYYFLYLFENSIRYFIIDTLEKHGKNWWEKKVGKTVRRNAQKKH